MKKILLGFVCIFSFVLHVSAYTNSYYYVKENGDYSLCSGREPGCFDVSSNTTGLSFSQYSVTYENITYYYSEDAQNKYDESQNGISTMFFYMKNDSYVLCKKKNSCVTYTREKLISQGAKITNGVSVVLVSQEGPGAEGETYYYNASYEKGNQNLENNSSSEENTVPLENSTCGKLKEPLMFLGRIVFIIKILIPIIIIIFGIIDFFRAMVGSKDDEIKKSAKSMTFRVIAGVIIFFLPTIVSVIFSLITDFANIKGDFNACQKCIFQVSNCK